MNKWKVFTAVSIILIVLIGAAFFVCRLREPGPSEIERVFDGSEAVFVEGKDLLSNWRTLSQTDYWQSGTYEGLQELPPVRKVLDAVHSTNGKWIDNINFDALMSAVGNASALGVYTEGGTIRFLFVSRVDPNFLLIDRILAFAGTDAGVTVAQYRGMRVKEAALGKGQTLLWALDGDFLILSDNRDIFYAAVDRRIDGTTGKIASNHDFRRLKKKSLPSRLISGYMVKKRLLEIPGMRDALSEGVRGLMPDTVDFSVSYAAGAVALDVEGKRGIFPFSLFLGNKKRPTPPLGDDEIAAAWVGRMSSPSSRDTAGPSAPEPPLPGLLPSFFPDGFSAFLLSNPQGKGEPGMIVVGGHSQSWIAAITGLRETSGLIERNTTIDDVDLSILDSNGVPYLAWAQRGDRIIVSGRPELLTDRALEAIEKAGGFGYTYTDGEVTVSILPRRICRELERSDKPIPTPFGDFSLDEQRRLFAAFYPAESVDGYASISGSGLKINIGLHVEDAIP